MQANQAFLRFGCSKFECALIPLACLGQVGLHALDVPTGKLNWIVGASQQQGCACHAALSRALQ